ncbi:isoleucine--tRNA ligase, mitochondrial [Danaus plexippus]|uniref:isoleucine--tRNA ligase, mitochondrial n=1 Tax=Danaus plexippus TaxID=13037 RepID=UPI002AB1C4B7|nr:isoleucine--tRNA ligase, mitochondrial [Danaus plexippus]
MLKTYNLRTFHNNYRKSNIKWTSFFCTREESSTKPKTKTYSHTVLFPKTNFPARSNINKEKIQKTAKFSELYEWQREHLTGPEFILHDGPPYANGDLHMGHAVNKIIKDINNRSQILQGNKVHYVPGWDCHGLPIEFKALQKTKSKNEPTDPVQTRQIARSFALKTVKSQKEAFESWGIMADWEKQCYLTLNKNYVQSQLRLFYKMYKSGLIYQALKPVYWSPSSRTALAEAELEYDPNFKSKEVYFKFPMEKVPDLVKNVCSDQQIFALIWTTTPWTLVANKAIAYNPSMVYCVVKMSKRSELFLIAKDQIQELERVLDCGISIVVEFEGQHLSSTTYNGLTHTMPLIPGAHVTSGKGTGLVHTAPAHGPDDFVVALNNNITVECNVDEHGRYINLGPDLDGLYVLQEGQETVMKKLRDSIIHEGIFTHSYPLDWRTKKPVILRASHQWFIDTNALKQTALGALDKVAILPPSTADQSRQGFRAQLEKRPYWCISRQRAWGVPIPALYRGNEIIVDEEIIENICSLIDKDGTDVWWTCDVKDLMPKKISEKFNCEEITKGKDIMDIWLDSGLSWHTLDRKAHLYSEGVDQLTGWFQASLLTSLALKGEAPYESIFVHGFVVDDKKRKMSKSIGNVIDPKTIIFGDKKNAAYGVDTLRWWVASHSTQHSQIVISKKLLEDCQNEVIRIRNIMKYLLGVISDLGKTDFYKNPTLNFFDRYMVTECHSFVNETNHHYDNFRYNHVAQNVLYFVSNKVSGLYCHCIKDRLYCSIKNSKERLAAQLVIHTILVSLCKGLGPILPHLIEEVWQYHPLYDEPFYFTKELPVLKPSDVDSSLMEAILDIKRNVILKTKNEHLKKFELNLTINSELFNKLDDLNHTDGINDSVLCEILELSSVRLNNGGENMLVDLAQSKKDQCLRCRKYNAIDNSDKCLRCEKVLAMY